MAKYYTDWNDIKEDEAPALIDAAARYLSAADYPSIGVVISILGIKKGSDEVCMDTSVPDAETI